MTTIKIADAQAASAQFCDGAPEGLQASSEYSEFIQATNGQSLPATVYEEASQHNDTSPAIPPKVDERDGDYFSRVRGQTPYEKGKEQFIEYYAAVSSAGLGSQFSAYGYQKTQDTMSFMVRNPLFSSDSYKRLISSYDPFPNLAPGGVPGLLLKGGSVGAIVGVTVSGLSNFVDYQQNHKSGNEAIIDTITETSICATAGAVGLYTGALIGSVVPVAGNAIGAVAGFIIGSAVGVGLEMLDNNLRDKLTPTQ